MINGGATSPVSLTRSLHQGCPLNPLLFALVTHPMLALLSQLAQNGEVVGLTLPLGSCCAVRSIVRHLGYPIGVDVSNKQLLEWISGHIGDKFMYWKSQAWPFYIRLKVAQIIMLTMLSYYLPLLPWSKKALTALTQPIRFMLRKKKGNLPRLTWVLWKHITCPKRLGGAALLDVSINLLARRWSLLQAMCIDSKPWIDMSIALLEHVGIWYGKTRIATSWWDVVNGSQPVRVSASLLLDYLAKSWQEVLGHRFSVPRGYRCIWFILQQYVLSLRRIPRLNSAHAWDDWVLASKSPLLAASANVVYHLFWFQKKKATACSHS
ncbi:hypothetical protein L7F22_037153 [Adiantum nelumboides]|nr:hypothetical protein [Adiantum nelumboides]